METTKDIILKWCDTYHGHMSWPTDGCKLEEHYKFIKYKNEHWGGGNRDEFIDFVRNYANNLDNES